MKTIQGIPDVGPGLRLHLNENTDGCSQQVLSALQGLDRGAVCKYPDYREAIDETAALLGVGPERVLLTNGLDEGILLASIAYLSHRTPDALVGLGGNARAMHGAAEVLVAEPAFEAFTQVSQSFDARLVSVPAEDDFAFPLAGMLRAITERTRIVFLNNPNNPTGQPIARSAIRAIAGQAPHALIFVDEAYHDFHGESFLDEARHHPNVLIGRTFSKAYGLAGLRVGVMVASSDVLAPIRRCMPLFNVGVAGLTALRAAIRDVAFHTWYLAQVRESKELIYEACRVIGLKFWPSAANFVLIDGGTRARAIVEGMRAGGVFVRDRTTHPGTPGCFRLTAGVVEHTRQATRLLAALCEDAREC